MNKPRIPLDYAKSQGKVPRAERRGERCSSFLWCSVIMAGGGVVFGWVARLLYAGGC